MDILSLPATPSKPFTLTPFIPEPTVVVPQYVKLAENIKHEPLLEKIQEYAETKKPETSKEKKFNLQTS